MQVQRKISGLQAALVMQKRFADDMVVLLTEQGIDVKRDSFIARLKAGKGKKDLAKAAKDVYGTLSEAKDLIEDLIGLL